MTGNIVKLPRIKQTKSVTGDISAQTVAADKNKTLSQVTVNPVSGSSLGTATPQDVLSGKTFSSGSGISVTGTGAKNVHVYGATWAGTSDPSWTRTDEAANFSDPNPYYAGMSGTPSSPFDGLMPWAGIRRVTDSAAGELVEIPKFWYKWTRSGTAMQLQIADGPMAGFYVSPAHADRGDGVGERDYVYVGRYHCASDYLSKTGVLPKKAGGGGGSGPSTSRATFRNGITALGNNIYMIDYALFWTIRMLMLVEYATWSLTNVIGYGCSLDGSTTMTMGYTDSMSYHTGTITSSRTTYGGTQYRYIEGLWDNAMDYTDGVYRSGYTWYVIKNPNNFSDSTGGTSVGSVLTFDGYITTWSTCSIEGLEYAIFPSSVTSSQSYVKSWSDYESGNYGLLTGYGEHHGNSMDNGMSINGGSAAYAFGTIGSRLMKLPSQRIN